MGTFYSVDSTGRTECRMHPDSGCNTHCVLFLALYNFSPLSVYGCVRLNVCANHRLFSFSNEEQMFTCYSYEQCFVMYRENVRDWICCLPDIFFYPRGPTKRATDDGWFAVFAWPSSWLLQFAMMKLTLQWNGA